jgi:hypothetical protein
MDGIIAERQKLIEAVNTLPDESWFELASFLDYLRFTVLLVAIPSLGCSETIICLAVFLQAILC